MQMFISTWNAISQAWGERLLAVVWQSTVLTLVTALAVTLVLRRSSPAVRYWIWQIVAIKLLVMPFWSWSIAWRRPIADTAPSHEHPAVATRPEVNDQETSIGGHVATGKRVVAEAGSRSADLAAPDKVESRSTIVALESENAVSHATPSPDALSPANIMRNTPPAASHASITGTESTESPVAASFVLAERVTWPSWLLLAWGVLVLVQVLRLVVQRRRLSRLLRQALPAELHLAEIVATTAARLGLRRVPQTLITQSDCSPFVCGIWRPKLILPRGLQEKLGAAELGQVLLHELAHIRRHDLIWSWIGEIARMVYFFHPAAHWICYQARLERELACDQQAMAVSGYGPGEYAATLVQVVSYASEPSVFKSAATANLEGERS